jgi:DNA mismatch repair protein MutS
MARDELDPTPLMKQYQRIKAEHPDAILFYRMGDFYETFFGDAEIASRELDIVLTARDKGTNGNKIPLAGIPYHALDSYLPKLIKKGYKVAIAEQTEDPKKAKGLVKREVVRIVTPGTMLMPEHQQDRGNTFLSAVVRRVREGASESLAEDRGSVQEKVSLPPADYGVAHLDISTGDFNAIELAGDGSFLRLCSELLNYGSAEVLLPESLHSREDFVSELKSQLGDRITISPYPDHHFLPTYASESLKEQFGVLSLDGYGLEGRDLALGSAGAVLSYARENQMRSFYHIGSVRFRECSENMVLDATTVRNLEVLKNARDGSSRGTLLELLDQTRTAMGSRLLRTWIQHPLLDIDAIEKRLDSISVLSSDLFIRSDLRESLGRIADLERILMRLSLERGSGRDLVALSRSLSEIGTIKGSVPIGSELLRELCDALDPEDSLRVLLDKAMVDDPPLSTREGGMIREGYSPELDGIRSASKDAKGWLKSFEEAERMRTGIRSLKVRFNNVFGYFIEVSNSNIGLVPPEYIRKQTISNGERYITPELKEKEALILNSDERLSELEKGIFASLCASVMEKVFSIQRTARSLAALDVLNTLSDISSRKNYVRPKLDPGKSIRIEGGRHPVIEDKVAWGFVSNDIDLDGDQRRIMVLTGPNMAGKSTYMRQVALIVVMAQIGCFVPAKSAAIGLIDRIFTRVGASDDLAKGQSTFMVEMVELASILNGATDRSLILLDEIGRGTSTYDGMAIAWAVVEHLSGCGIGSNVVFATHYHHLTSLEGPLKGVVNYHMAVKEQPDGIAFLRKVMKGPSSRSYGVEVAKLAGVPASIVERARELLPELEERRSLPEPPSSAPAQRKPLQMVLFPTDEPVRTDPIREELQRIDPNNLTPMQALEMLYKLRKHLSE